MQTHQLTITTESAGQTEQIAEAIGRQLRGGEVIELVSDLGGGKTTFVHGLARGFGSHDKVSSPTFTISKVYTAGQKEMHHFDFYRLPEAGLMSHELADVVGDPDCVVVVEWAEVVQHVLPAERLKISIRKTGEEARQLELTFPTSLSYLTELL